MTNEDRKAIAALLVLKVEAQPVLLKALKGARTEAERQSWRRWISKNSLEIERLKKLLSEE